MYEFIRAHQLNIMLLLCGSCGILAVLLIFTRFLSRRRKSVLIIMETVAFFLLWFDRLAYIYAGAPGPKAYVMVRVSNFAVFFLTSAVIFCYNLYLCDLVTNEGKSEVVPKRLKIVGALTAAGMLMAVIAAFTGMYYYFDENNLYHRGTGFLIAYIIPVLGPVLQFTVIREYRKSLSRLIYFSVIMYIIVPLVCGILQIFTYGISMVNMSLTFVSISLYFFMYTDLNDTVERAHEIEISNMKGEQNRMKRLFDQTATAFVSAVEKKDDFIKGNSLKVADYSRRIAELSGKSEEDCEKAYYAALLHDVGLIGIPDSVIKNETSPDKLDYEAMREKPLIGEEILSSITEYPYLSQGARYSHERYNGTGYPEGLKGKEIPEIARIIGAADAYVTMTTRKRYRDAMPGFMAREAFIKGAGEEFDPEFAWKMVSIMDSEASNGAEESEKVLETEITCGEYREQVSLGIPVDSNEIRISFDCEKSQGSGGAFSAPSIVLYDSFDARVHRSARDIERYGYLEYGEIWFDRHSVTTAAVNIVEKEIEDNGDNEESDDREVNSCYEIIAGRYDDHMKLIMRAEDYEKEVIVAIPSSSKATFIGLTGENCHIMNIRTEQTGKTIESEDIPRIAQPMSYIEHFESDIKNIQIGNTRSATTEGVELVRRLTIRFHAMSLPVASLVWHCPYILLYSSDDGSVDGPNYKEYEVVKLDGENERDVKYSQNIFVMKKTEGFPGWDAWKEANKEGMNCEVFLEKKGNQVVLRTENLGINIEDTVIIKEEHPRVYVALTGDMVALTDISVK